MKTPPLTDQQKIKFAVEAARNSLADNLQAITELMDLQAAMTRQKYEAHIRAGFAPEQALYLSKEDARK
ncbi:MAG: hypothetical protein M0Q95_18105 [Porticoccaceae bacterium]|nr:hypothetical protein [Porticoccaceae bacterium]